MRKQTFFSSSSEEGAVPDLLESLRAQPCHACLPSFSLQTESLEAAARITKQCFEPKPPPMTTH